MIINKRMAYRLYEKDMQIINIITDNDFISVSEFSQLLNTIMNINCITPYHINTILKKHQVINKQIKNILDNQSKMISKYSKYLSNNQVNHYCKIIDYNFGKFYIWNANLIFVLLGVNFFEDITKKSAVHLYNNIKPYVFQKIDINTVYRNLILLQLIFRDCVLYQ